MSEKSKKYFNADTGKYFVLFRPKNSLFARVTVEQNILENQLKKEKLNF